MKMDAIVADENIIDIEIKRGEYEANRCNHHRIAINERLAFIKCRDCGETLDPLRYLIDQGEDINRLIRKRNEIARDINDIDAQLKESSKCRCQHCGKMTRINGLKRVW